MHKAQVFGYLLVSFLTGIFVGAWFENAYSATVVFVLIGTIAVTVSAYEKTFAETKKAQRNRQVGIVIGACVLILALGVFRYGQANLNQSVLTEFVRSTGSGQATKGIPVITRGFVDNEMSVKDDKAQLIFHVIELEVPGRVIMVDERTLIFLKAYPTYQIGDLLSVQGALQLPDNFAPDFDYVQYLKNKDIRTTISYPKISFESTIRLSWPQQLKIGIYKKIFAVKDRFQSSVARSLPAPYSAYINGILLGTRQDIPADLTDAFNKTSTTHILAISGYNITIIADALLGALVFFMRRRRAFWVSVAVIILFTIMTGAGASVVRAAIMGLLLLFANGYGRMYDPKNSILLAAGVMIFLDPLALRFDVGFQLSFLAVLGLMYIGPILKEKFKKIPERFKLKETVLMSISAQIMVAPLLAYIFHTFSLVSIPANLLVLPLMPYTMLFGFLTGLGGLIAGPLGQAVGLIALALASYQINVIRWLGGLSFSAVTVTMSSLVLCFLYSLIVFGIWSVKIIRGRTNGNN
ncbi:MAG: ComEC/Rec2 family competence protein [Patescibacteria group bacterium]